MKKYSMVIIAGVVLVSFLSSAAYAYSRKYWSWGGFNPPAAGSLLSWTTYDNPQYFPPVLFVNGKKEYTMLDDLKGRFVLLNLWATWCAPCVAELPALNQLQKDIGRDDLYVVAALVEKNGLDVIKDFYSQHGIDELDIWVDVRGTTESISGLRGLPTTILIDPFGEEILRIDGPVEWAGEEARNMLQYYFDYWYSLTGERVKACEEQKNRQINPYRGECR